MPTFQVVSRSCFFELLVLRRAMGICKIASTMTRAQESRLYKSLIAVSGWNTVSAEYDVVHPNTFVLERKSESRSMHQLLTEFKFNDEPSDKVTQEVMAAMSEVPQNRRSRRMLASICATINGRSFLHAMLRDVRGLSRMDLYNRAKNIIKSSGQHEKLFTSSFNRHIYNRANHKSIALKRLQDCKRATKKVLNMRVVKRRDLQLSLVKNHGLLLGKNAYAYLERSYSRCGFASGEETGCGRSGTVLGPGAQSGANVLLCAQFKQGGIGTSFDDAVSSYTKSQKYLRRLRTELRGILRTLITKQKSLRSRRGRLLVRATKELLHATDCEQQFLLSELGKISEVVFNLSQNYARSAGMGDGDSDAEIGDSDTDGSDESV